MTEHRFDQDIDPPEDVGPFLPRPDFFAAIGRLSAHGDLAVRYYAAEQIIALMIASIPSSEAAVHAVDLVDHILSTEQVRDGVQQFLATLLAPEEVEEWDQFGDDGQTANLALDIVSLPKALDRAAALSSLALHAVEGAEIPEPHLGHIYRFLRAANGERPVRRVT